MAAPFTAEDQLVKRSMLSSILDVAKRLRTTPRPSIASDGPSAAEEYDDQQPCSSTSLYYVPTYGAQSSSSSLTPIHPIGALLSPVPVVPFSPSSATVATGQSSPTASLGHQLHRQLDLNRPSNLFQLSSAPLAQAPLGHHDQQQTQHEIYREIVRECRAMEQQHQGRGEDEPGNDELELEEDNQIVAAALGALPAALSQQSQATPMMMMAVPLDPSTATDQHVGMSSPFGNLDFLRQPSTAPIDHAAPQQHLPSPPPPASTTMAPPPPWLLGQTAAGLSLEHLVKIVVATVREVTGAGGGEQRKKMAEEKKGGRSEEQRHGESAEEILERRRQQNNAAAARYRRRQQQVENGLQRELAQLARRNSELKADIAKMGAEIAMANAKLGVFRREEMP